MSNVSQLRDLLQELLDTDPAFRQMLQGDEVTWKIRTSSSLESKSMDMELAKNAIEKKASKLNQ